MFLSKEIICSARNLLPSDLLDGLNSTIWARSDEVKTYWNRAENSSKCIIYIDGSNDETDGLNFVILFMFING